MKRFAQYITEVHFSDYYHKNFVAFRQKYLKLMKDYDFDQRKHFVQFTNYKEDKLDKTASQIVDHHDPIGTYGYPMEYVLKHPADIWYGYNAKFLRVLKSIQPQRVLNLQNITEQDAINFIFKLKIGDGWNDSENLYRKVMPKYLKNKGGFVQTRISPGRIFFACIQLNPKEEAEETSWGEKKKKFKDRTGQEQTELLLKLGYTAVQDTARNQKQAIVNDREPEQIIFLRRDAFEIVEVISLNQKSDYLSTSMDPVKIERPFIQKIAELLDDKISEGPERTSLNGWSYYWTKKGRRIEIEFGWDFESYTKNLKMGEKPHKKSKLYDKNYYHIVIRSEFGDGKLTLRFPENYKFDEALKEIEKSIVDEKRTDYHPDQKSKWTPETKAQFLVKQKKQNDIYFWENLKPYTFLGSKRDYFKEKFGDSWFEELEKDKTSEKINDFIYETIAKFLGITEPEDPDNGWPLSVNRLFRDYLNLYLEKKFSEKSYPIYLKSIEQPRRLDAWLKTRTKENYLKLDKD
jgi:hypothetical protein